MRFYQLLQALFLVLSLTLAVALAQTNDETTNPTVFGQNEESIPNPDAVAGADPAVVPVVEQAPTDPATDPAADPSSDPETADTTDADVSAGPASSTVASRPLRPSTARVATASTKTVASATSLSTRQSLKTTASLSVATRVTVTTAFAAATTPTTTTVSGAVSIAAGAACGLVAFMAGLLDPAAMVTSPTTPVLNEILEHAPTFTHLTPAEQSAFIAAHTVSPSSTTPPPSLSSVLLIKRRGQAAYHAISTRVLLIRTKVAELERHSLRHGRFMWGQLAYCHQNPHLDAESPLKYSRWRGWWPTSMRVRYSGERWDGAFPVTGRGTRGYFERLAGFLDEAGMGKGRTWESLSVDEKKRLYGMVWMWAIATGLARDGARRIEAGEMDAGVWSKDRQRAAALARSEQVVKIEDGSESRSEEDSDEDEDSDEALRLDDFDNDESAESTQLESITSSPPEDPLLKDWDVADDVLDLEVRSLPDTNADIVLPIESTIPPAFLPRTRTAPMRPAPLVRPLLEPAAAARPPRADVRLVALGAARPVPAVAPERLGAKKKTADGVRMRRRMGGIKGDADAAIEMALESWV
ncbi:hypothetical protein HDU96_009212 [Phlyctochytrium bullatum]|nr:hypothetical protein HDU96_009212 [Phlyctochytrium bullatum]